MDKTLRTVTNTEGRRVETPREIEQQEARGQAEFTASDVMPKFSQGDAGGDELLRTLGFQLGGDVKGDRLFRYAKLPRGWTRRATDHSMWTDIVDEKGRRRISVFYKAAFYDRDAFFRVKQWLEIDSYHGREEAYETAVLGGGQLLRSFGPTPEDYQRKDDLRLEAAAWATERFPGHTEVVSYWNLSAADIEARLK